MQAIDQMKPTISRAMATLTTLAFLRRALSRRDSGAQSYQRLPPDIANDSWQRLDDRGTGQGSVIALLANIYHYCFDLWAERWRRREARGA